MYYSRVRDSPINANTFDKFEGKLDKKEEKKKEEEEKEEEEEDHDERVHPRSMSHSKKYL